MMKKSFLLYTISGVLFYSSSLSYALSVTLPPSSTEDLSSVQPRSRNLRTHLEEGRSTTTPTSPTPAPTIVVLVPEPPEIVIPRNRSSARNYTTYANSSRGTGRTSSQNHKETPLTRSTTIGTTSSIPDFYIAPMGTEIPNAIAIPNVEQTPPKLSEDKPESATTNGAKSRRRPVPSLPSTNSITGENRQNPPMPPQSMPRNSASATPEKPELTERESAKPAPAKPSSVQEMAVKPDLEKPIPEQPEKQSRKLLPIESFQPGVVVRDGKTVTLHHPKIYDKYFAIDVEEKNSLLKMIGGTATADFVALNTVRGGTIEATDIVATAQTAGLVSANGTMKLKDSTVHVTGRYNAAGIALKNDLSSLSRNRERDNAEEKADAVQEEQRVANRILLENTKIVVEHGLGIGVYGSHIDNQVSLQNSEIHADMLLKNKSGPASPLTLTASHSFLEGRVRTLGESKTIFDLKDGTKWLLKANKNVINNDDESSPYAQFGNDEKSYSNLSELSLTDSTLLFEKPRGEHYQTLFLGSHPHQKEDTANTSVVYSAKGNAEIHLNAKWSGNSPVTKQETDRVVIHGDVSGTTIVHMNLLQKDKKITDSRSVWGEHMVSIPSATHGISVIQVSGKANENSFKLAGDYMTIGGLPYKYELAAYKPGTSHANQSLFGKNDQNFWDFRLQNAYLDKDKKIRALLPQVANYLVMPNALFSAGYTDINNQNILLDNMRSTVFGAENNKNSGIFLSSFGEKVTLFSNRDPLHYGYDADVNYAALQLGVVLAAREGEDISTHFGLLGSYGKLSFTPEGMQDAEKTTLDKWSITAYSSIQHNNGLYINGLLSYGALKGKITTALVGNAAKLDGTETLSVSATIGQKLATGSKGLVFEPQAQLTYQNLFFDLFSDANGLEVDMRNPHQWLIRIGGRLTQTLTTEEDTNAFSFYGKLNILKAFGESKTIKIADAFYLDPTGSSIEGGIGVNAFLSQNIALHGDISYRQKLQKAGVSGTNFSGGIRYHF